MFLKQVAHRWRAAPTHQANHTGCEPVISAVTGQRPLLAGLMGRKKDAIEIRTQSNMFCRHVPLQAD